MCLGWYQNHVYYPSFSQTCCNHSAHDWMIKIPFRNVFSWNTGTIWSMRISPRWSIKWISQRSHANYLRWHDRWFMLVNVQWPNNVLLNSISSLEQSGLSQDSKEERRTEMSQWLALWSTPAYHVNSQTSLGSCCHETGAGLWGLYLCVSRSLSFLPLSRSQSPFPASQINSIYFIGMHSKTFQCST